MASITTRETGTTGVDGVTRKNAPLTNSEIDQNFININNGMESKAPINNPSFTGTVTLPGATEFYQGGATLNDFESRRVIGYDSEGLTIYRGGLELDDTAGAGAGRITWRNSSGQLAYIEEIGDGFAGTGGLRVVAGVFGSTLLSMRQHEGVIAHRPILETLTNISPTSNVLQHNFQFGCIFTHSEPNQNFTVNFTNVPTTFDGFSPSSWAYTTALVITQGSTPYLPTAVQINGDPQTILWEGGSAPDGNANGVDVVTFSILRTPVNPSGVTFTVLASLTSFA
jgi:hypothetical protein